MQARTLISSTVLLLLVALLALLIAISTANAVPNAESTVNDVALRYAHTVLPKHVTKTGKSTADLSSQASLAVTPRVHHVHRIPVRAEAQTSSAAVAIVKYFVGGDEVLDADLRMLVRDGAVASVTPNSYSPLRDASTPVRLASVHPGQHLLSSASELAAHQSAVIAAVRRLEQVVLATEKTKGHQHNAESDDGESDEAVHSRTAADTQPFVAPQLRVEAQTSTSVGVDVWFSMANSDGSSTTLRSADSALPSVVLDSASRSCRSRRVYVADPLRKNSVQAAFVVEVIARVRSAAEPRELHGYRFVVARESGRVLSELNLKNDAQSFTYRVFADASGDNRPLEGPRADTHPHPTEDPADTFPFTRGSALVSVAGGMNQFSDPWLADDATVTNGNNVDAYADVASPDGFSAGDFRASTTSANTFDYTYDPSLDVAGSPSQIPAEIVHAFYTTNYLHDYWYDSGFDEAAGNAQASNYGRGGVEGDSMRVELSDYSALNNANMLTPADGSRPRMQMFQWMIRILVDFTGGIGVVSAGGASFGPKAYDVIGDVAVVTSDPLACTALTEDLSGKVALISRGSCSFQLKVLNAEAAGAVAAIIVNTADTPVSMGAATGLASPIIPAVGIASSVGAAVRSLIAGGSTVSVHLQSKRDAGGIDTMIVAHEWGHYLHHRLTSCGVTACAALSEGISDFVALHLALREGDNLDGVYADSNFVILDSAYFGIRRAPYSTRMDRNPLTFKHIVDGVPLSFGSVPFNPNGIPNSEVHNAGEVWAEMMWEAYVALHKSLAATHTFEQVRRRMTDIVVSGFQLAAPNTQYTQMRDALLTAAAATSIDDAKTMATAFAKRGIGACAVDAEVFGTPVVESYDADFSVVHALVVDNLVVTEDPAGACNVDGLVGAGENGVLSVTVTIPSSGALYNPAVPHVITVTVTVDPTQSSSMVSFTTLSQTVPQPAVGGSVTVAFPLHLSSAARGSHALFGSVQVSGDGLCSSVTTQQSFFDALLNAELVDVPNASATDYFQSSLSDSVWTRAGTDVDAWTYESVTNTERVFVGHDLDHVADNSIVSPPLQVSAANNFVVEFDHVHSFEHDGFTTAYDGGVVEVSTDDGATWQDAADFTTVPYGATLYDASGNPLGGRAAFSGMNAQYPAFDTVTVDFGTQFAGQSVRVRFRVVSDESVGDLGWVLARVAVSGIDNTPFPELVVDPLPCSACSCVNGGSCNGANNNQCSCIGQWGGVDCGTCQCENGGTCTGAGGSCVCPRTFYGPRCSFQVPDAPSDGRCAHDLHCNWQFPTLNGSTQLPTIGQPGSLSGYCGVAAGNVVGSCTCLPGIGGSNCQCRPVESCSGRGICVSADGSCTCHAPFGGPSCAGCDATHFGATCQLTCASCFATGTASCVAATGCVCASGFAGATCSDCDSSHWGSSCQNSCSSCNATGTGSCSTGRNGSGCVCHNGYTGATCSTPPPPPSACSNDRQCMGYGAGRADNGGFFEAGRCVAGTCSCTYSWAPNPSTGAIGTHCQCRREGSCELATNRTQPYAVYDWNTGARLGCAAAGDVLCA